MIALVVMCVICVGSFVLCGVAAPENNNENSHSTMAVAMENDRLENTSNRNEDTINNYNNVLDDTSVSERIPSTIPSIEEDATSSNSKKTHQSILDDYTQKIEEATPRLIEEYYEEAALNTNGLEGLATLSNDKVLELADICTNGVEEMAEVMWYTGSGSYSEYEEWAAKLYDVYMDEAGKITEAYMNSAQ